jgi:hypothetical protein
MFYLILEDFYTLVCRKCNNFFSRRFLVNFIEPSDSLVLCEFGLSTSTLRYLFKAFNLSVKIEGSPFLVFYSKTWLQCNKFFLRRDNVNFIPPFDLVVSRQSILIKSALSNTFKGLVFPFKLVILLDFGGFIHFKAPQVQLLFLEKVFGEFC